MFIKNKIIIKKVKDGCIPVICFERTDVFGELLQDAIKIPNDFVLVSNKVFLFEFIPKVPKSSTVLLKLLPYMPTQELSKMCSLFLVSMG